MNTLLGHLHVRQISLSLAACMTPRTTSRSTPEQTVSGQQLPGHHTDVIAAVCKPTVQLLNPPASRVHFGKPCVQHITWQKQRQSTGMQHTYIGALPAWTLASRCVVTVCHGPAQQKLADAASPQERHVCCPLLSAAPASRAAAAAQQPAGPADPLRAPCIGTLLCHVYSIC